MARFPQVPFINNEVGLGVPIYPSLPPQLAYTQGNIWHVKPVSGSDVNNSGKNPQSAFKTLGKALYSAKAGQNDIVFDYAESNTASATTDYQNALLDWNKDLVHLIGINAGSALSPRSRVAFQSAYNTATGLFKVSANGCYIANMEFFMGVAGTLPVGCMEITGQRNHLYRCHIAGFGGAAGANDIPSAYSLKLTGAQENLIEECTIGVQTIELGANTNSQVLFASSALRNVFKGCRFLAWTSSATNHVFVRAAAASIAGFQEFLDCNFINDKDLGGGTAMTYAMVIAAGLGGSICISGNSQAFGASKWAQSGTGPLYIANTATATSAGGVAVSALS